MSKDNFDQMLAAIEAIPVSEVKVPNMPPVDKFVPEAGKFVFWKD